jgi:hypothetical protein
MANLKALDKRENFIAEKSFDVRVGEAIAVSSLEIGSGNDENVCLHALCLQHENEKNGLWGCDAVREKHIN